MEDQSLSLEDIRDCQKAILDFVPVPVTEKQRQALENYRAGKLEEVRDDISLCGDYGKCLLALLNAEDTSSNAIECLDEAAKFAIKYAGVADGKELYAKLSEVLPAHFNQ